jgi:hypothetical protein
MRRICAGVKVGNICSIRELFSGSPLRVSLIEVVCGSLLLMGFFSGPILDENHCVPILERVENYTKR